MTTPGSTKTSAEGCRFTAAYPSTQTVLPNGSPAEVRAAVEACRRALAPDGTGLLLAPSHRMMADIPMENVEAMLEAFQAFAD